jgi:hypothetical protein
MTQRVLTHIPLESLAHQPSESSASQSENVRSLKTVDVKQHGALEAANKDWGLALGSDEISYLTNVYAQTVLRDPTDVELMMFGQV